MAPCLPVELIEEIVSLSSKSDLPALCRTSKLFREIVEPLIYRRICIPCGDTLTDDRLDSDRAGKMLHWIVGLYNSLRDDDCKVAMVERVEVTDLMCVWAASMFSHEIATYRVYVLFQCIHID